EGGGGEGVEGDVRQDDQVEAVVNKTVETWGQVDVLINNAGATFVAHAHDISPNGFAAIVAINLNGTFLFSRATARVMMAKKTGGNIIKISSDSWGYGSATMSHYGAGKDGVIHLTRSLGI